MMIAIRQTNRLELRILSYFVNGSITVWLTSCLTGLELTNLSNFKQLNPDTKETGGQSHTRYSETSPYEVNEYSLARITEEATDKALMAPDCSHIHLRLIR